VIDFHQETIHPVPRLCDEEAGASACINLEEAEEMSRKRALISACVLALIAAAVAVPGIQLASGGTERLTNGSFEEGFHASPSGFVGNGWHQFTTGGQASYGFYDETWAPVIYDGGHGQLIEINTYNRGVSDPDRYAGIYQTVAVTPGETYELSLNGMLRVLEEDPDREGYNYRVQYGVDYNGGADWTAVTNWVEIPWDTVHPRLTPGAMESFSTNIKATSTRLTLFIRAWKKWGTAGRELDVNLDAISLKGSMPVDKANPTVKLTAPAFPVVGWDEPVLVLGSNDVGVTKLDLYDGSTLVGSVSYEVGLLTISHNFPWTPSSAGSHTLKAIALDAAGKTATATATVTVGQEGQFLTNGDFEGGFKGIAKGVVGNGWGWFDNGGQAAFGFYDETWAPVVYDGAHGQLIEINTYYRAGSDPDRYAGVYQTVTGLTPGATYKLSMHGMLRALADDADLAGYNYRVQWGYDPAGGADWTAVTNWVEVPWDTVYPRLAPGEMSSYTVSFAAPSSKITLFIRAWKKWGTAQRELDVNLDAITLKGFK
jgi:hypothetical protein